MNILLNGVGRIGKAILRIASNLNSLKVVAINELNPNIQNIAYSINYDSTYGRFEDHFDVVGDTIANKKQTIKVLHYQSLADIDYQKLNIDIIIDASGAKIEQEILKKIDVKKIFLTHPNKMVPNVVLGVNDELLEQEHKIIATSSCNATALLPILTKIDEHYQIEYADVTTVHPLLNHQKTLDGGCIGSDDRNIACNFEFGRGSLQNIIPSRTTTIEACSLINPKFNAHLISSHSFRTPTPTVGAINLCVSVKKTLTKEELIQFFQTLEDSQKYKIFLNNYAPLVSSDFIACQYTSIIDHRFTQVVQNKMIKLVLWYDNEYGYASKVVDMVKLIK